MAARFLSTLRAGVSWRARWWRSMATALAALITSDAALAEVGPLPALEPLIVGVVLNAVLVSDGEMIYTHAASSRPGRPDAGGYWVRSSSLVAWRLRPDTPTERVIESQRYQQVCSGEQAAGCFYDDSGALVTIHAGPERFTRLRITAEGPGRALPEGAPGFGAYANYDLLAAGGRSRLFGVYTDAHVFSPYGNGYFRVGVLNGERGTVLTSRTLGWQWDQPERASSITLGGFYGGGSTQRPIVPMLGLRYASDYALRPDISLVPRPRISSSVERPSRADLFVDGLFRRSGEVPYGSFDIEADSLLSGLGRLELVLTDQRGLQTVETLGYYFAPQLLPQGLTEFSAEAGFVSPDPVRLSLSSQPVLSGTVRQGRSDVQTVSATAVWTHHAGMVGVMSDCKLGTQGVLRGGLSLLRRNGDLRPRALIGHEFQSQRLSTLFRLETAPGDRQAPPAANETAFNPVRLSVPTLPTDRHALTAALSVAVNERHQFTTSFYDRTGLAGEHNQALALSATYRPSNRMQVGVSVQRIQRPQAGTFIFMSLVMPLGDRHLAVVTAAHGPNADSAQWTVQSLRDETPEEQSQMYRVFGELGDRNHVGASYQRNESFGQWAIEGATTRGGDTTASARLSGAVGWMPGSAFATRRIDDSFVVVDSDGQPEMPIFFENRYVGRTDARGRLVIPQTRAYQSNQVSIDASAMPIEYTLAQDQLQVVPRRRSGTLARFEISDGGVLVPVQQADGSQIPAGAQAEVSTQSRMAAVGSRSEVFINRANRPAEVVLRWPGRTCRFDYLPPSDPDPNGAGARAAAPPDGEPYRCR